MRYVVIGAGAVGGTIGGRLHEAGRDVVLVARGAHLQALHTRGLQLDEPGRSRVLRIPVAATQMARECEAPGSRRAAELIAVTRVAAGWPGAQNP